MNLSARDRVVKVEERFRRVYVSGIGKEAIFDEESIGWYVTTSSGISLCVGPVNPGWKDGDVIELSIRRVN